MKALIAIYVKAGFTYGLGHLNRSINLAAYLNAYSLKFLLVGDEKASSILESKAIDFIIVKHDEEVFLYLGKHKPELLIVDARDTSLSFMKKLIDFTKVLSLDDLARGSMLARITVNALAKPPNISLPKANFEGMEYLVLSDELAKYKKEYRKNKDKHTLLLSFGGEDPYSLSSFTYDILYSMKEVSFRIKIVLGPLYKGKKDFPGASVMQSLSYEDFCCELAGCDILLTSFGMTVYEALFLGKKVFTINPSDYHNSLADSCEDIINIGVASKKNKKLIKDKLLAHFTIFSKERKEDLQNSCIEPKINARMEIPRLVSIIEKMLLLRQDRCPICGEHPYSYLREGWVNYYYCENCFSFFRSFNYSHIEEYKDDYFTGQYKAQYGKTYLEDKSAINILNRARLKVIRGILLGRSRRFCLAGAGKEKSIEKNTYRILELGSAMGFFLEEATMQGLDSYGIEISSYAAGYAIKELALSVIEGDFTKLSYEALSFGLDSKEGGIYDVISAWYFIEHNRNFVQVLKKIRGLLKRGGLLCLSTPNCRGVSFLRDKETYIKRIPSDHYIEFSPRSLSILLSSLGFRTYKIVIRGLHFGRFIRSKRLRVMLSILKKPLLWFFGKRHLGDTFEIYARKER